MSSENTPVPDITPRGRKPLKERRERKRAERIARRQRTAPPGGYVRGEDQYLVLKFLWKLILVVIALVIGFFFLAWVWGKIGPHFEQQRMEEEASRILTLNEIQSGLPDDTKWRYPAFTHNERLIIPTNCQLFEIGMVSKHLKIERSLVGPPYKWQDETILNNVDEQKPKWLSDKREMIKIMAIRLSPETLRWSDLDTRTQLSIRRVK